MEDLKEYLYNIIGDLNSVSTGLEKVVNIDLNVPSVIAEAITFDNSHLIAWELANSDKRDVAIALYNELKYWVETNGKSA